MKTELVKQYLKTVYQVDLDVDIVDETLILIKEGCYHLYISDHQLFSVGTVQEEDIEFIDNLRKNKSSLLYIITNSSNE